MNVTIKTLMTRRSIRKYKQEQIPDEKLKEVLEAGMYAPSATNEQAALIIVIQKKETVEKINSLNAAIWKKGPDPYYGAPAIILVLADKTKRAPVEDGCLVLGNMMNAAASLGLGTCWIHRTKEIFESEEGRKLLKEWGVEGDYIGVGSCGIGYPDCELPKPAPRKSDYVMYIK